MEVVAIKQDIQNQGIQNQNDLPAFQDPIRVLKHLEESFKVLEQIADRIHKSGLFGFRKPEEALTLMLLSLDEGVNPIRAIREYHILQGRPALRADAMLARFQKAGGRVEWHELTDEVARATFYHPMGGRVVIEWTIERARRAGLLQKSGSNWERYPRAMLRARVISEGVRTVFPGVIVGMYTPEELFDLAEPNKTEAEVIEVQIPQSEQNEPQAGELEAEQETQGSEQKPEPPQESRPTPQDLVIEQAKKLAQEKEIVMDQEPTDREWLVLYQRGILGRVAKGQKMSALLATHRNKK